MTIKCWGSNWFGQAPPLLEEGKYGQVSSGFHHSCALYLNGSVTCFGENNENQCDTDSVAGMSFAQVTASGYHSCALKSDLKTLYVGEIILLAKHRWQILQMDIHLISGATHTCAYMVDSNCPSIRIVLSIKNNVRMNMCNEKTCLCVIFSKLYKT